MNIYRHGDLLIRAIAEIPKEAKKQENTVLAHGEHTGHKHVLVSDEKQTPVVYDLNGKKYFTVLSNTKLQHEEHNTITIKKGSYEVVIERERDPFTESMRQVQD